MKHTVYQDAFNYRVAEYGALYKPVAKGTLYELYAYLVHRYAYRYDKSKGTILKPSTGRAYEYADFIEDLALKEGISFGYNDLVEDETGTCALHCILIQEGDYVIQSHHVINDGSLNHFYTLAWVGFGGEP